MLDIIRDSTAGQLVNKLSRGRLLPYADQRADYVVPERYRHLSAPVPRADGTLDDINNSTAPTPENGLSSGETRSLPISPEAVLTSSQASAQTLVRDFDKRTTDTIEKITDVEKGDTLAQIFRENLARAKLHPELEVKIDPFLVDWDGPNDPDNPRFIIFEICLAYYAHALRYRNWSRFKKCFVAFSISLLTFSGKIIYLLPQRHMLICILLQSTSVQRYIRAVYRHLRKTLASRRYKEL